MPPSQPSNIFFAENDDLFLAYVWIGKAVTQPTWHPLLPAHTTHVVLLVITHCLPCHQRPCVPRNSIVSSILLSSLTIAGFFYVWDMVRATKIEPFKELMRSIAGRHMMSTLVLLLAQWCSLLFCLIPSQLASGSRYEWRCMTPGRAPAGVQARMIIAHTQPTTHRCWWNTYDDTELRIAIEWMYTLRQIAHSTFFATLCFQVRAIDRYVYVSHDYIYI